RLKLLDGWDTEPARELLIHRWWSTMPRTRPSIRYLRSPAAATLLGLVERLTSCRRTLLRQQPLRPLTWAQAMLWAIARRKTSMPEYWTIRFGTPGPPADVSLHVALYRAAAPRRGHKCTCSISTPATS